MTTLTKNKRVLLTLSRRGPLHPPLLARVAVGENSCTPQLMALLNKGLIEKRSCSGNAPVTLTAAGRKAAREIREKLRQERVAAIIEAQT